MALRIPRSSSHSVGQERRPPESSPQDTGRFNQMMRGEPDHSLRRTGPGQNNLHQQYQQPERPQEQPDRPLRHAGASAENLHQRYDQSAAQPSAGTRPTPQQLPRLNTTQSILQNHPEIRDNPRLHPPSADSLSPQTPPSATMGRYSDPGRLPGADGTVQHNGHSWDTFGRTEVPQAFTNDHQQVRQHMAGTDSGRKYLAHLEQGQGAPVSIVPYEASGGRRSGLSTAAGARPIPRRAHDIPLNIGNKIDPETRHIRNANTGDPRTTVTYPVNQGMLTGRGETISGATMASHELRHASHGPGRPGAESPLGDWTSKTEKATITKGDNPTALTHGESLRDDHKSGVLFETGDITSKTPMHPTANRVVRENQPDLQANTRMLDQMQADTSRPDAAPAASGIFNQRSDTMQDVHQDIGNLSPTANTSFLID